MWATENASQPTKKTKSIATLDRHIQDARKEFARKLEETPSLRKRAIAMRTESHGYDLRYTKRQAYDMRLRATELEREADIRESRVREDEYERLVAPYIKAYQQRVEVDCNHDNTRDMTTPGSGRSRETIDMYVKQSDATANRQTVIVNEYLMQVQKEPPRLALHTRDQCPLCAETMRLVSDIDMSKVRLRRILPGCHNVEHELLGRRRILVVLVQAHQSLQRMAAAGPSQGELRNIPRDPGRGDA